MKKDLTLLILAAGMGSRFGGLKQIEAIGPNGEFIIDYSIYDAIKTGFTKIVFIIRKENYEIFKKTVGKRIEDKIEVEYVFQNITDLPNNFFSPKERVKPWGTGHALLVAKNNINEPFAIISSDDFYGRDSFEKLATFLKENKDDRLYSIMGYQIENTVSKNGAVKRGIFQEENGFLKKVTESVINRKEDAILATPLNSSSSFTVDKSFLASMLMFGLYPTVFDMFEREFYRFLEEQDDNFDEAEFLLTEQINNCIVNNDCKVKVIETNSKWLGVTYREDLESVVVSIKKLIDKGHYPLKLWG